MHARHARTPDKSCTKHMRRDPIHGTPHTRPQESSRVTLHICTLKASIVIIIKSSESSQNALCVHYSTVSKTTPKQQQDIIRPCIPPARLHTRAPHICPLARGSMERTGPSSLRSQHFRSPLRSGPTNQYNPPHRYSLVIERFSFPNPHPGRYPSMRTPALRREASSPSHR